MPVGNHRIWWVAEYYNGLVNGGDPHITRFCKQTSNIYRRGEEIQPCIIGQEGKILVILGELSQIALDSTLSIKFVELESPRCESSTPYKHIRPFWNWSKCTE